MDTTDNQAGEYVIRRQWAFDGEDIPGETGTTYTPTVEQLAGRIEMRFWREWITLPSVSL
jgi:hypothetical protein